MAEPGSSTGLQGSFVMQKSGPLPNWAWMALGLGGALGYAAWKSSKAKKAAAATDSTSSTLTSGKLGTANGITYAFVDADSTVNTLNAAPPGGGRPPGGPDRPPPDTPAPEGQWVSVTKWTKKNAPWNSTLYGIADHLWGNGDSWKAIWNAPENAALKKTRKDPEQIEPGDKVWVPNAANGSGADQPAGHSGADRWSGHSGGSQPTATTSTHRSKTRSRSSY